VKRVRESVTVSEIGTFLSCARKYFYRYVALLSSASPSDALRFGTAWHAAMEARTGGADYETALNTALTVKGNDVSGLLAAHLAGLLAGYYAHYGTFADDQTVAQLYSEVPFTMRLAGTSRFAASGKIDGLGVDRDGLYLLNEYKTCGEDIGEGADYWARLRFNWQLLQYIDAARRNGWNVRRVIYDVTRKPTIRPLSNVPTLDADGLRQVVDADGQRVYKSDGTPIQTARKDKGESVLSAPETLEAYTQRLFVETRENPGFYFARREVPVLDSDIEDMSRTRLTFCKILLSLRALSKKCVHAEDAWMRNVTAMSCRSCEYSGICLNGHILEGGEVPNGMRRRECKHEELAANAAE